MANRPMFAMLAALTTVAIALPALAQDGTVIKGGTQMNIEGSSGYSGGAGYYPAPQMIPQAPKQAPVKRPAPPKKLKATVQEEAPQQRPMQPLQGNMQQTQPNPPMQANVQASPPPGVLPQQFMGNWLVLGQRSKVEALPQYQSGIDGIFTGSNSQTWNIVGGPGGYSMNSSSGVSQVQVGNCTASTAFVRYQHQVGKTMAQEAIVMQLSPDGRTFQGMQRITIKKPGESEARAQVTYQLMGRRQ